MIDDCTFRSNTGDGYGGALLFEDACTADFTNCQFEGNGVPYTTADGQGNDGEVWETVDGGALYVQDYSVVTLKNLAASADRSQRVRRVPPQRMERWLDLLEYKALDLKILFRGCENSLKRLAKQSD